MRNTKKSRPACRQAGLYDPFLDTLGGGELHVLSILQVLSSCGYEPYIFWDKNLSREIKQKFSLTFINKTRWVPNMFGSKSSLLKKHDELKNFDVFIYVTYGSYFFSSAKKNFIFCMVPDNKLYQMNQLNRFKTLNYQFIANSRFTGNWLNHWGIKNEILYPYIDDVFFTDNRIRKEKLILSVGRFFSHLHSKQHEIIIRVFEKFLKSKKDFESYTLILAGGLKKEDKDYFQKLQKMVKNNPNIELKPNVSYKDLVSLYQKAEIFWHFTGFGVNEKEHPEMVEHFGIAPLQAMASRCITFCYNAGGPKEFMRDGENGFLFNDEKELLRKMELGIKNKELRNKIIHNAKAFVKKHFSYEVFEENVKNIFSLKKYHA